MTLDEALKLHAIGWQWFNLHAQQRMQIVSFWFVAMSFLSTGGVIAYAGQQFGAALLVASSIVLASAIFLILDLRTRELISYGEHLMEAAETSLHSLVPVGELLIVGRMHSSNRKQISYRTAFTLLYGGAGLLGLLAVVFTFRAM